MSAHTYDEIRVGDLVTTRDGSLGVVTAHVVYATNPRADALRIVITTPRALFVDFHGFTALSLIQSDRVIAK
jgi:hypothetical protein